MFQIERKMTPFPSGPTLWYGNVGARQIASIRQQAPNGFDTREQAEEVAKALVQSVEDEWVNTRSEHAGKSPLGVSDLFVVVEKGK